MQQKTLLRKLQTEHPDIKFIPGERYSWSPENNSVTYRGLTEAPSDSWSLLHEVSHAILKHSNYQSDLELVQLESQAWERAKQLGEKYNILIDSSYIEDCIDTYREWLHQRGSCPHCSNMSTQKDSRTYYCFNCGQSWRVTNSKFCRPYRKKITKK